MTEASQVGAREVKPLAWVVAREVRALALPAILHSLLQMLVFVVDRAMLGHHGSVSLAAMQIAGPVEWSVWSIFSAFTVGTIARVGRHVGAGDRVCARRAAWISLALAAIAGTLLALMTPFALARLEWAYPNASTEVVDAARGYLAIALSASPIVFLATAAIAILQASGDTRTPLAIGIAVNAVHVALNFILILGVGGGPALGTRGAAISTAVTFALAALGSLFFASRLERPASLRRRNDEERLFPIRAEFAELAHVATPALFDRLLYHAGFLGFVVIIARLGDVVMAANQALVSIESICFLSADGFGVAAAALVAQKLGKKQPTQAILAAKTAIQDAAFLLTTFGILFFLLRNYVLAAFTRDPEIARVSASAVWVLVLAQPFMATAIVVADALRGGGFTRSALVVSAGSALFVRLACTYLFAIVLGWGLVGVWLGSTADWIVRTLLFAVGSGVLSRRFHASAQSFHRT